MRFASALCLLALFVSGVSADDPYPHKNHVAFLDGSRVLDASDLSELSGWKVRYCYIVDGVNRRYSCDREIDLDKLWLNGVKYDQTGRVKWLDPHSEILIWYARNGAVKAVERKDGGIDLVTLRGDEMREFCKWSWAKLEEKAFAAKILTLEELRAEWRKIKEPGGPVDPRQLPVVPPAANPPKALPGPPVRPQRAIPVPQCPKVFD